MPRVRCAAICLLALSAGCANVQPGVPSPPGAAIKAPARPGAPAIAPRAAAKSAVTLDMAALTSRLRNTSAIGVFTKLALKNQMDDLLALVRAQHQSGGAGGIAALRQPFDMLVLKVLAVVQDGDPALARTLSGSREALWGMLADPVKFNALA